MAASPVRLAGPFTERQLLEYADTWRSLAREWARMARDDGVRPALARHFRRTAQTALFAAHEAEELVRHRVTASERPPRGPRDLPRAPWDRSPPPARRAADDASFEWLRRPPTRRRRDDGDAESR